MATINELAKGYADEIWDSVSTVRKSAGRSSPPKETIVQVLKSISNLTYTDGRKLTADDVVRLLNTIDRYLNINIGSMSHIVEKSIQSAIAFEEALDILILQIEASGQ